ncbi:ABC transporter permease [Craterilacuibacter sp. RT1T]|uniref:ABC transporter permease n=1 Tax=Craterilacuibacter sp. RT1T TaxID=2942211 RepID=UPI0020BFEB3A|nr:ABC transporter permease [Craterilacuibacter sp. RT1T]MCL6264352.1 ABC transporter permease [Craterilacuibacter sp. RT1T]
MIDMNLVLEKLPAFFGLSEAGPALPGRDGLLLTLELLAQSLLAGFVLALPLALLRASKNRWLAGPVWFYTYVFRGTPMLVQLFLIYYGLAQFEAIRDSWAWIYLQEAYWCAIIAFTLNTAAYTTEIIAGQIRNTAHGEIEAARAIGMSRWQTLRRIALPSALRRALPAYSNEVVMMLQGTAIAGLVTLADLTGVARQIYSDSYQAFEPFLTAGAFYLTLTFLIAWLFRRLERRYLAHLGPRSQ